MACIAFHGMDLGGFGDPLSYIVPGTLKFGGKVVVLTMGNSTELF